MQARLRHRRWKGILAQIALFVPVLFALVLAGCGDDAPITPVPDNPREIFSLQTLPAIPYPVDNAARLERISLGRFLFYDPILSGEKDTSCGTCHHPDFAFADRRQFGAGVSGVGLGPDRLLGGSAVSGLPVTEAPRNTPTIFNTAFNLDENGVMSALGLQFWDGRAQGLEVQATKPIASRDEMRGDAYPGTDAEAAAVTLDSVLTRLRAVSEYELRFRSAFPAEAAEVDAGLRASAIDGSTYGRAIAAFERELVTTNSRYDRYVRGDDRALDDLEMRGLNLFFGAAKCSECHGGPLFTDFEFVVQGVPQAGVGKLIIPGDDCGLEEHTLDPVDRFAFRTPSLRNVELTPPYMHDGVFATLEEVMAFYNDGAKPRHPLVTDDMLDPGLRKPLGLSAQEVAAVIAFLGTLTDPGTALDPYLLTVPERVPSGLTPVFGLAVGK